MYLELAQYQKAIDDYSQVIELNPKDGYAYYCRAEAYEKLGKKDLAEKDKEMAEKLGYNPPRSCP